MVTIKQIADFLETGPVAVAGVSRNPKKFGFTAFKELKEKGLNVIPVNPEADEILGIKAYNRIADLPPDVKSLLVLTKKDKTEKVVKEALEKGINNIWIQQMSDSKAALTELEGKNVNLITGECILMHYKPHSIHKFHRLLRKIFGSLPK